MKRLRVSISTKFVSLMSVILTITAFFIVLRASSSFRAMSTQRESDIGLEQAQSLAGESRFTLQGLFEKTRLAGSVLAKKYPRPEDLTNALDLTFRAQTDVVAVALYDMTPSGPKLANHVVKEDYFKKYDTHADVLANIREVRPIPFESALASRVEVTNSSIKGGPPLTTFTIPLTKNAQGQVTQVVVGDFRQERLQKMFSSRDARVNFLINSRGDILAHPQEEMIFSGQSLAGLEVVKKAMGQKLPEFQTVYADANTGERFVAASVKSEFGTLALSQIPEEVILEPSMIVRREAFFVTGLVLSVAFFVAFLFSATLTRPLEILAQKTIEVAKGNFNVKARVNSRDEVGDLSKAFDQMIDGLKERDKVKTLFGKFHGTGIANKLMSGEMKLGGEQRNATVFFSDIRSFTSFSEKHQPHEVVEMLNSYFKIMVGIVTKNHGVVDKFIGDAIMAVWGAPESHGNDARNAITACLEMRKALKIYNDDRIARGVGEIKIGMGIHSGTLIAGTVGSDDRMEYTVIGDTVNLASRIEAATKAYGTDLLVSEDTYNLVKDFFIWEEAGSATVKGKEKPLLFYKVRGYKDDAGLDVIVETPYSSYQAEDAEKVHKQEAS